jgi:hypothetical protein
MNWFRDICGVPNRNFTIAIHLYPDTPVKEALNYWSKIAGLPKEQFEKIQIDQRQDKSSKKRRRLPYGTAHITVHSRGNQNLGVTLHRRILGWIEAVYRALRV